MNYNKLNTAASIIHCASRISCMSKCTVNDKFVGYSLKSWTLYLHPTLWDYNLISDYC